MIVALLTACSSPDTAPPIEPVDLMITGTIRPGGAEPRAILIRDGAISQVVAPEDAAPFVGPDTVQLSADVVTAGFVDAHAHPQGLGSRLATLDLTGIDSYAATVQAVAAAVGDGWLVGRGWDQNDWSDAPEGGWPRAADLDAIVPDRPVYLRRIDGHAAWLNSAALAASGIDASTADPPGGRILRDAHGAPSGVLVDAAMDLVKVPAPPEEELRRRLRMALDTITASGLTGVHVMGASDADVARYQAFAEAGELPVRLWVYVDPDTEAAQALGTRGPWGTGRLRVVGIKAYADGALGSRGALLSLPYSDEPEHNGLAITTAEALRRLAIQRLGAGAQLAVHAIGDQGVRNVLDAIEAAREAHPQHRAVRHRVEHAQVVHPDDRSRFAALNTVASMQPTHATSDMPWAPDRLGPERIRWAYSWRTLADEGALLAFGSDFPVEEVSPALGLWAATRRTDLEGNPAGGWLPQERLTEDDAIAAFTTGAAAAVHEAALGRIQEGNRADLTLWRPHDDRPWEPIATIVDGQVVWSE